MRHPQYLPIPVSLRPTFQSSILKLCRDWSVPIRAMATRTDTHDMGFIILPALKMDWELTGNEESLRNVIEAAEALASRWDEQVGAIRSWDQAVNHRYQYTDMQKDFLVIIDSMCSLSPFPSLHFLFPCRNLEREKRGENVDVDINRSRSPLLGRPPNGKSKPNRHRHKTRPHGTQSHRSRRLVHIPLNQLRCPNRRDQKQAHEPGIPRFVYLESRAGVGCDGLCANVFVES